MARQRKSDAAELTPAVAEPEELVVDFPLEGAAAAATTPGGMVRISKGTQQRCIWPVHLSGWQQLGWSVVGAQEAGPHLARHSRTPKPVLDRATAATPADQLEPLVEPLSAIDSFDPLEPLNPSLDQDQDLDPLAWDDTTAEQP